MAQLNKALAKQTEEAESGSFEPMPDGVYHARLRDVDTDRSGQAGPYWSWEYEVVEEGFLNRRQWNNTSLSEKALWKLKETFEAFGVPADTDTDDLLGKVVKLTISTRTIQQGARKGESANQVDRVSPADEGFELPEGAAVGSSAGPTGADGEEDIF